MATLGRKRGFDKTEALHTATLIFWQKGFVGTSLSDLTQGMGINKPSLYAAFGNKATLFISATEHYVSQYAAPHFAKLENSELSIEQRLIDYICSIIEMQCDQHLPSGCFISLCAAETASLDMPKETIKAIKNIQTLHETRLLAFFEQQVSLGKLDKNVDCLAKTIFILSLIHGCAVLARSGKSAEQIKKAIIDNFQLN